MEILYRMDRVNFNFNPLREEQDHSAYVQHCQVKEALSKFGLKIFHCNVRSLNEEHFDNVVVLLCSLGVEFDVIIFTECWADADMLIPFNLAGYEKLGTETLKNRSDGVCVFICEKSISRFECRDMKWNSATGLNLKIWKENREYSVLCCYRSPSY